MQRLVSWKVRFYIASTVRGSAQLGRVKSGSFSLHSCVDIEEHQGNDIDTYHCPRCVPEHGPLIRK